MIFQGFRGFNFFQWGPIAYKTYITCDFPRGSGSRANPRGAILSTFIKLPFVFFEWPFYTGFTVDITFSLL